MDSDTGSGAGSGAGQTHTSDTRVTLLTRPGCHLCDVAREVIDRVCAETDTGWVERDITAGTDTSIDAEEDRDEYWDKIPVTLVDGRPHSYWRVSADELRTALCGNGGGRRDPHGGTRTRLRDRLRARRTGI